MKKKVKILLIGVFVAASVAAGAFYMLKPVAVEVEKVTQGSLSQSINERGEIVPEKYITLNANKTGTIVEMPYGVGGSVKEGDVILQIDSTVTDKEMKEQIASLKLQQSAIKSNNSGTLAEIDLRKEQLRQQLMSAQQEYDRLFGEGSVADALRRIAEDHYFQTRRDFREAFEYYEGLDDNDEEYHPGKTEVSLTRAQMNVARENLAIANYNASETAKEYYKNMIASYETQLAMLEGNDTYANNSASAASQQLQITIDSLGEKLNRKAMTATEDGVIWQTTVEQGDFVAENQPVMVVYNPSGMYIKVLALAEDALQVKVGDKVECKLANGQTVETEVRFISPVAVNVVSTIGLTENRCIIELQLSEPPAQIGAGYQVDVKFKVNSVDNAISVSAGSIVPTDNGNAVYVVRDNKAQLVEVEVGSQRSGRIEILSGLSADETIVKNPYDSEVQSGKIVSY